MLLRFRPTPTRFPTNSLYTPMGHTAGVDNHACGVDWATSMAPSWVENPTDQEGILLKHQFRCEDNICKCDFTTTTCGKWSLVTNEDEVGRRFSRAIELLALCLDTSNNHVQRRHGVTIRATSLRFNSVGETFQRV